MVILPFKIYLAIITIYNILYNLNFDQILI